MQTRTLGRTGLEVSVLGFGCGAVGGLMVRATPPTRSGRWRAPSNSASITSIPPRCTATANPSAISAACCKSLKPELYLGTKVRIPAADRRNIAAAVTASLEASLQRLQLDHVDLFQLHNHIMPTAETLT